MRDQFLENYYIAKSYGMIDDYLWYYRFFRKQKVSRAFAAYYSAKEIGV
jgi:hypothetical protein